MRYCLFVLLLICFNFFPVLVLGESAKTEVTQEISFLLDFIENSDCIFIRNQEPFSGSKARRHIENKYRYISKRKTVSSAQMFISDAASRSSVSRKPYRVICDDLSMSSEQWLLEALGHYRRQKRAAESPAGD